MSIPVGGIRNTVAVLERLRNTLGGWDALVMSVDGKDEHRTLCHIIRSHLDAIGVSVARLMGEDVDNDRDEETTEEDVEEVFFFVNHVPYDMLILCRMHP